MTSEPETDKEKLSEIVLRQGELRLDAQLKVALAADRRSISFANILISIGAASIGLALNFAISQNLLDPLTIGFGLNGLVLLIAFFMATSAALPTAFALIGAQPKNWWDDQVEGRPLSESLKNESINYGRRIDANRNVLSKNAELFRQAVLTSILAPVVSVAAGVWAAACLPPAVADLAALA